MNYTVKINIRLNRENVPFPIPGLVFFCNHQGDVAEDAVRELYSDEFGFPPEDIYILKGMVPRDMYSLFIDDKHRRQVALFHRLFDILESRHAQRLHQVD